jgi:hypothetical protein
MDTKSLHVVSWHVEDALEGLSEVINTFEYAEEMLAACPEAAALLAEYRAKLIVIQQELVPKAASFSVPEEEFREGWYAPAPEKQRDS